MSNPVKKLGKGIKSNLSSLNRERKRATSKVGEELKRPFTDLKESLIPEPPELPDPIRMPDPDDESTRIARMRSRNRKFGGRGRQGTALSAGAKLG